MSSKLVSKSADNFHMRQKEGEEGMFTFVCCQVWKYNVTLEIVPFAWSPPPPPPTPVWATPIYTYKRSVSEDTTCKKKPVSILFFLWKVEFPSQGPCFIIYIYYHTENSHLLWLIHILHCFHLKKLLGEQDYHVYCSAISLVVYDRI